MCAAQTKFDANWKQLCQRLELLDEAWLLDHPTLGKPLRDWRSAGAIPRPAKALACAGMPLGVVVFWYSVEPSLPLTAGVALVFLACAGYVVSRPAMGDQDSSI